MSGTSKPTTKSVFLKVIMIGDSGVGKTTLIYKYFTGEFRRDHKATLGADFFTKEIDIRTENGTLVTVTLQLWDTAGQERFESLGNAFYRGANACVLVYDIGNQESFANIDKKWKDKFLNHCSVPLNSFSRNSFPFLLIGNKTDLALNASNYRQVSQSAAKEFAHRHENMLFVESNAISAPGLEQAMQDLIIYAADVGIQTLPSAKDLIQSAEYESKDDDDTNSNSRQNVDLNNSSSPTKADVDAGGGCCLLL